ncbi:hypothetical protein NQ314_015154 [Rhamnusium bicolor]|uniref:cystathionine gamma-lyase n=1 Tax=Rhamnusium bicolor TaxID=1586634 RepID=A0AAV8WZ37_9CUCU|nr:hypothetical protein NQ314_015154 [Rhamnusium bicolor]
MGEKAGFLPFPKSFETICMHHGQDPTQWKSKAVIPHIVPSTIFEIDDPTGPKEYIYSRVGNPTRSILESVLAAINKGRFGLCFSSGMSALTAILGLLKKDEHLICCEEISGDSHEVFKNIATNYGICTTFVDVTDINIVCKAIQPNTKLIWVENPSNATLKITDICSISKLAKENEILVGVDNTFLTPYLQRPLELGADIVMHSLTKYMNGHSDIIMGSLCVERQDLHKQLSLIQVVMGLVPSPIDCYQVIRGLKTLGLRMDQHHINSIIIAKFLDRNSVVEKVVHPGLRTHANYNVFKQQASGHSGILSFYIKGGLHESVEFIKCLPLRKLPEGSKAQCKYRKDMLFNYIKHHSSVILFAVPTLNKKLNELQNELREKDNYILIKKLDEKISNDLGAEAEQFIDNPNGHTEKNLNNMAERNNQILEEIPQGRIR